MDQLIVQQPESTGVAASREQHQIQSMILVAKKYPRDEHEARLRAIRAMDRPGMAQKARYKYERGGKPIAGPSVHLVREIARQWRNVRYGTVYRQTSDEAVRLAGYAHDTEQNLFVEVEDEFQKKVQRRIRDPQTGVEETRWVTPDERDLRELVNKRAAIALRNALLQVLPSDLVEECMSRAGETLRAFDKGQLQQSREQTIKSMVLAYDDLGVTPKMIEGKLGHALDLVTADEITELREIFNSLSEGHSQRQDHFSLAPVSITPQQSPGASEINAFLSLSDATDGSISRDADGPGRKLPAKGRKAAV